jgi:predicted nucleotidyltransferase
MRTRRSLFRRPLDRIFSAPSHVAILRALLDSAEGMSGRRIARLADVNHQACATALGRLEEVGVVQRQGAGQSQLFRLNREHVLVRDLIVPLLKKEREAFRQMLQRLGHLVTGRCRRAVVFGSVARGHEEAESDLDLLLIAESPSRVREARDAAEDARSVMLKEWGARVSPIVLTERAVALRSQRKDPLVTSVLREGIDLGGGNRKEQGRARTRTAAAG